jgi:hypothetical protein
MSHIVVLLDYFFLWIMDLMGEDYSEDTSITHIL